jgi:hypothetical protein
VITVLGTEPASRVSLTDLQYEIDDTLICVCFALPIHTAFGRFVVAKCQDKVCILQWSAADIWRGTILVRDAELFWKGALEYRVMDLPEAQAMQISAEDARWNDCRKEQISIQTQSPITDQTVEVTETAAERAALSPPEQVSLVTGACRPPWPSFVSNPGDVEIERLYNAWFQHLEVHATECSHELRRQLEDSLKSLVSDPEWNALQRFSHWITSGPGNTSTRESDHEETGSAKGARWTTGLTRNKMEQISGLGSRANGGRDQQAQRPSRWRSFFLCLLWISAAVCALVVYRQNFGTTDARQRHAGTVSVK